jgi:hypothetical protein
MATLDLTGQLVIGPFQKPGINVLNIYVETAAFLIIKIVIIISK